MPPKAEVLINKQPSSMSPERFIPMSHPNLLSRTGKSSHESLTLEKTRKPEDLISPAFSHNLILRRKWAETGPGEQIRYTNPYTRRTYISDEIMPLEFEAGRFSLPFASKDHEAMAHEVCKAFSIPFPESNEAIPQTIIAAMKLTDPKGNTHNDPEGIGPFNPPHGRISEALAYIESLKFEDADGNFTLSKPLDPLDRCTDAWGILTIDGKENSEKAHFHAGFNDIVDIGLRMTLNDPIALALGEKWYSDAFPEKSPMEIALELMQLGVERKLEATTELTSEDRAAAMASVLVAKALDPKNEVSKQQFKNLEGFIAKPNLGNKSDVVKNEEKKLTHEFTQAVKLAREQLLTKGITINSSEIAQLAFEWIYPGANITDLQKSFTDYPSGSKDLDQKTAAAALAINFGIETDPVKMAPEQDRKAKTLAETLHQDGNYLISIDIKSHSSRVHYVEGENGIVLCSEVKDTVNKTLRDAATAVTEILPTIVSTKKPNTAPTQIPEGIKGSLNAITLKLLGALGDTENLIQQEKENWSERSRALALAVVATAAGVADAEMTDVATNTFTGWAKFTGEKLSGEEALFNAQRTQEITKETVIIRKKFDPPQETVIKALEALYPPLDKVAQQSFIQEFATMSLQTFAAKVLELPHEAFVSVLTQAMEIKTRPIAKTLTPFERKIIEAEKILFDEGYSLSHTKTDAHRGAIHGKIRLVGGVAVQEPCPNHPTTKVDAQLKQITKRAELALQQEPTKRRTPKAPIHTLPGGRKNSEHGLFSRPRSPSPDSSPPDTRPSGKGRSLPKRSERSSSRQRLRDNRPPTKRSRTLEQRMPLELERKKPISQNSVRSQKHEVSPVIDSGSSITLAQLRTEAIISRDGNPESVAPARARTPIVRLSESGESVRTAFRFSIIAERQVALPRTPEAKSDGEKLADVRKALVQELSVQKLKPVASVSLSVSAPIANTDSRTVRSKLERKNPRAMLEELNRKRGGTPIEAEVPTIKAQPSRVIENDSGVAKAPANATNDAPTGSPEIKVNSQDREPVAFVKESEGAAATIPVGMKTTDNPHEAAISGTRSSNTGNTNSSSHRSSETSHSDKPNSPGTLPQDTEVAENRAIKNTETKNTGLKLEEAFDRQTDVVVSKQLNEASGRTETTPIVETSETEDTVQTKDGFAKRRKNTTPASANKSTTHTTSSTQQDTVDTEKEASTNHITLTEKTEPGTEEQRGATRSSQQQSIQDNTTIVPSQTKRTIRTSGKVRAASAAVASVGDSLSSATVTDWQQAIAAAAVKDIVRNDFELRT